MNLQHEHTKAGKEKKAKNIFANAWALKVYEDLCWSTEGWIREIIIDRITETFHTELSKNTIKAVLLLLNQCRETGDRINWRAKLSISLISAFLFYVYLGQGSGWYIGCSTWDASFGGAIFTMAFQDSRTPRRQREREKQSRIRSEYSKCEYMLQKVRWFTFLVAMIWRGVVRICNNIKGKHS